VSGTGSCCQTRNGHRFIPALSESKSLIITPTARSETEELSLSLALCFYRRCDLGQRGADKRLVLEFRTSGLAVVANYEVCSCASGSRDGAAKAEPTYVSRSYVTTFYVAP